jgi:hypothetical protein
MTYPRANYDLPPGFLWKLVWGNVTIADGKTFADEDGNICSADNHPINGKTLRPCLLLADNDGNRLYYPTASDFTLNAFRSYFQLKNGLSAGKSTTSDPTTNNVRAFTMDFGEGQSQGIMSTEYRDYRDKSGAWYSLDGRKLEGRRLNGVEADLQSPVPAHLRKGIYIHNGRKVVVK